MKAKKQIEVVVFMEAFIRKIKLLKLEKLVVTLLNKGAMRIFEVALSPFVSVCGKSYKRKDLSEEVEKESHVLL